MGMGILEYIFLIEDAFKIRIPDDEAEPRWTVGQMHEYLVRRLPTLDPAAMGTPARCTLQL